MSKYEELIERVEKLTGPDREVDRDILRLISGRVVRDETFIYGRKHGTREIDIAYPFKIWYWPVSTPSGLV